jgi:hypothetical protein
MSLYAELPSAIALTNERNTISVHENSRTLKWNYARRRRRRSQTLIFRQTVQSPLTSAGKRPVPENFISKEKCRKVKINRPVLPSSNDATFRLAANQFFDQNELIPTVIDY